MARGGGSKSVRMGPAQAERHRDSGGRLEGEGLILGRSHLTWHMSFAATIQGALLSGLCAFARQNGSFNKE